MFVPNLGVQKSLTGTEVFEEALVEGGAMIVAMARESATGFASQPVEVWRK